MRRGGISSIDVLRLTQFSVLIAMATLILGLSACLPNSKTAFIKACQRDVSTKLRYPADATYGPIWDTGHFVYEEYRRLDRDGFDGSAGGAMRWVGYVDAPNALGVRSRLFIVCTGDGDKFLSAILYDDPDLVWNWLL